MTATVTTPSDLIPLQQQIDELRVRVAALEMAQKPSDPPPPPSGDIPSVTVNPPALMPHLTQWSSANATYVQPRAVENADGTFTLYTVFTDKNGHGSKAFSGNVTLRYIVDGERLGKAVADPAVFKQDGSWKLHAALTIPRPADGVHWITVRLIDGLTTQMSVEGQVFTVGKTDNPGAYMIPSFGGASLSGRYRKNLPDLILYDGGPRKKPNGKPRGVKLVPGITASGGDPVAARNLSYWWCEPFTHLSAGLYTSQPDLFRNKDGWVIAKNWAWHAQHNATAATVTQRRKPEYNGPRLTNGIDAYSMGDFGDKMLWLVSLRGTLTRTDIRTGFKEAVAGRVFKEDTIPLDPSDASITQAQIDAANYTLVGDAVNPEHLEWDGPHTVMACPWNPDNEAIICDSFKHRFIHVDASVSPAKVTVICGTTKGREAGPVETAKINRPYAHVVYPDRRIVFCCTPKAGEEADGAIFELSADWKTLREVAGPDKVTRPFWLCEFEPGFVLTWEHSTSAIKKVNVATGEVTNWAVGSLLPDGWGTLVCDVNGTIGNKYDVYFAPAQSDDNTKVFCFDRNGVRFERPWMKTSAGAAAHGPASNVFDLPGHYIWLLIIHRQYALAMSQGWGELAPHVFRPRMPDDPVVTYDHNTFGAGKGMFEQGTLNGFPYTLRPPGTALRSVSGHSFIDGIPSLTELNDLSDAELLDYFRSGMGGSFPRPEWKGKAAEKLLYWARWHADDLRNGLKPPTKANAAAPKITGWSHVRNADGSVTVNLTTDKPTYGCICDFREAEYTDATDYTTSHTLTLPDCGPSFVVRLADLDDNQIQTATVAA